MKQETIFSPFFATILLTFFVWVYMYIRRIQFITTTKMSPSEMATPGKLAQLSPAAVSNPSDNFKNLFEIPILFYLLVIYLFVMQQVDLLYVSAAWGFFILRTLHSIVHCTFNLVILRFYLYLGSTLIVWFIATRAAITHIIL